MSKIYHFLRLIRFLNIIVIAMTMGVIQYFLNQHNVVSDLFSANFYLLITSTLLIASAGNIINDYFDVRADRLNKPKRMIIGVYIKRRWAMLFHWTFNGIGFIISLYLGYILDNIYIPITTFLSINTLWFYSTTFKRKPFIGNLFVALLLAFIPVYVLIYNYPAGESMVNFNIIKNYFIKVVIFVSTTAFFMNLIRELIKDVMDIRGDLKLGAQTFPIKYGIKNTKFLISGLSILLMIVISLFAYFINLNVTKPFEIELFWLFLIWSTLSFISSIIICMISTKIRLYKIASNIMKLAMLLGLLTPLFL